jgi:5-methylcytosine-specific restriction endonuclease McrA
MPNFVFPSYPKNWDNLRWWIKRRDNLKCVECGSQKNLHVHHIIPLSRGGSNHPSNLQTLCEDCHTEKHPHMIDARTQKSIPITYLKPSQPQTPLFSQLTTTQILILGTLTIITLAIYEIAFLVFLYILIF